MKHTTANLRANIAIAFDVDFGQSMQIYEGVRDFAMGHTDWNLIPLDLGFETALSGLVSSGKIDGIIGSFISDTWLAEVRESTPIAVVNVSQLSEIKTVSTVGINYESTGRLVAEHFYASGNKGFGFLGVVGQYSSSALHRGFSDSLQDKGETVYTANAANEAHWATWLEELPKPACVFTTHDTLARRLIHVCERYGFKVPDDITVVGLGDITVESIHAGIGLSSIALPSYQIGQKAAELLKKQLSGAAPLEVEQIYLPAGDIIQRESSMRGSRVDIAVEKALSYIKEHLAQPLVIGRLAADVGVSRRSLEIRFQEQVGRSPYKEIQRLRLEKAKSLLETTSLKIYEIAQQCGYPEQHPFAAAFRKQVGMSPKAFRNEAKALH